MCIRDSVHRHAVAGARRQLDDHLERLNDVAEHPAAIRPRLPVEPGPHPPLEGRDHRIAVEPVRAVRERFGDGVPLQVDANTAYRLSDAGQLAKLDEFGLLLIEQPLGDEDLRQHADRATLVRTPICLDESIVSLESAADAIALRAAAYINIKPGRVGGHLEAKRIHDLCVAAGVGVWCGGMLETGIGRAANAALAALPGFTLPGDISASGRFYARDITTPIELVGGFIEVPRGVGFGVEPIAEVPREVT